MNSPYTVEQLIDALQAAVCNGIVRPDAVVRLYQDGSGDRYSFSDYSVDAKGDVVLGAESCLALECHLAEPDDIVFENAVDEIVTRCVGGAGHTYWNTDVDYYLDLPQARKANVAEAMAEIAERFKDSPFRAHISY